MIIITLVDESSYAACDEVEILKHKEPTDEESDDIVEDEEDCFDHSGLVLIMKHVRERKGMKAHLIARQQDEHVERTVIVEHHNRRMRINGLRIETRLRDETHCRFKDYEVLG